MNATVLEKPEFKTWKNIKLGTGLKTADDFRKAIKSAGMKIDEWANYILDKPSFTVATSEMELELVVVSVYELGFKSNATCKEIFVRAQELGLDLCPAEVGPCLRLQHIANPRVEEGIWLVIAMEPLIDLSGNLYTFYIGHDGADRWLKADRGGHGWDSRVRLVFTRQKNGKINTTVLTKPEFKTWKTIKLGTGLKSVEDFHKAIEKAGMRVNNWGANDVLGEPAFTVAESVTEVELVVCSVAELGFKNGATRKDIYVRAQELGLDLCPAEVGPQLRLQYMYQFRDEFLVIAMEPIINLENHLALFKVWHNYGKHLLDASHGHPAFVWNDRIDFVFVRRK